MNLQYKISCFVTLLAMVLLNRCIGVDKLNDPKDPAIITNVETLELKEGEVGQIDATYYYNMWVAQPDVLLTFLSSNSGVATVDQNGRVSAINRGQADIQINLPSENLNSIVRVSVVSSNLDVATVVASATKGGIAVGEEITFTSKAFTITGVEVEDKPTVWVSSNPAVLTIDANGRAKGISNGSSQVSATIDGIKSNKVTIVVGQDVKAGDFVGTSGYKAVGTAMLKKEASGKLTLTLSDNFETSFALGTFVYLANSTAGAVVRSQGVEIAEIKSNGGKSFDVSAINPNIGLDNYRYVIILCKPASITFGFADMK